MLVEAIDSNTLNYLLVLNLEGYDVETAHNGATALERLAVENFDLVVTDCVMPILDGISMVLALRSAGVRSQSFWFRVPARTHRSSPQVAREISAILPKPARTAKLLSAVANALRGTTQIEFHPPFQRRPKSEGQPSFDKETIKNNSDSFALPLSKIIITIALRLRALAKNTVPSHLRFSAPLEATQRTRNTSHKTPSMRTETISFEAPDTHEQFHETHSLPPIVRIVLTQVARHLLEGQITPVKFEAQVLRLAGRNWSRATCCYWCESWSVDPSVLSLSQKPRV